MTTDTFVTPYHIGPYDRIVLFEREVKLVMDGNWGKTFDAEHLTEPYSRSNAQIKELLDNDDLVVERNYHDPRRPNARTKLNFLRNLPDRKQAEVALKLEWINRFQAKLDARGRVSSDYHMPEIMDQIRREYKEDLANARKNSTFLATKNNSNHKPELKLVTPRTLRGWVQTYKDSGDDWRSLVDGRGTGKKTSKFTKEELDLQGRFLHKHLSRTRPDPFYTFRLMKAVERRINKWRERQGVTPLDLGGKSTFYNRIVALPDFHKYVVRHGDAKAIAHYTAVIGKDHGYPMDLVEADECRIDLVVLLDDILDVWKELTKEEQEAYRLASERLWFSAVVDRATNIFLGFRIHKRAPSVDTALATFELTTRDKTLIAKQAGCRSDWPECGGFRSARLDSATWYRSHRLTATLTDAGASKIHPPARMSFLRGTIERIFKTIRHLTLQAFSGRTFSNAVERGDADPRKGASVNVAMLEKVFIRAIVDIHHNSRGGGKLAGMSPRQAWRIGCQEKLPPYPPTGAHRRHIWGINLKRVITREGIRVLGFYYQSDEIQKMRRNKTSVEVDIRVGLDDLASITVFDGQHTWDVPSSLKLLRGMSYWKATALLQDLDLVDTEYTKRTQDQVDDSIIYIDRQAAIATQAYGLSSPIVTQDHIDRLEKKLRRGLKVEPETEYTREVRDQDFSITPWLADGWGLNDAAVGDDLDLPASQSKASIEAKYGAPAKRGRKSRKSEPEDLSTDRPRGAPLATELSPSRKNTPEPSAKYREEF